MSPSRDDVIVFGGVEVHLIDHAPFVGTKIVGSVHAGLLAQNCARIAQSIGGLLTLGSDPDALNVASHNLDGSASGGAVEDLPFREP